MKIAVAGPYSAATEAAREANLTRLNAAAARLLDLGHAPVVGVNAALPVVTQLPASVDRYEAIMRISMAAISGCDAILVTGESRGANLERDYFLARRLPVFYALEEVPPAGTSLEEASAMP